MAQSLVICAFFFVIFTAQKLSTASRLRSRSAEQHRSDFVSVTLFLNQISCGSSSSRFYPYSRLPLALWPPFQYASLDEQLKTYLDAPGKLLDRDDASAVLFLIIFELDLRLNVLIIISYPQIFMIAVLFVFFFFLFLF